MLRKYFVGEYFVFNLYFNSEDPIYLSQKPII